MCMYVQGRGASLCAGLLKTCAARSMCSGRSICGGAAKLLGVFAVLHLPLAADGDGDGDGHGLGHGHERGDANLAVAAHLQHDEVAALHGRVAIPDVLARVQRARDGVLLLARLAHLDGRLFLVGCGLERRAARRVRAGGKVERRRLVDGDEGDVGEEFGHEHCGVRGHGVAALRAAEPGAEAVGRLEGLAVDHDSVDLVALDEALVV
mmetsp:Transcript_23392/g.79872  ORF Transcript_23392/g.79872 Transcript_23392/m.79872 type:complete len:208 (-) Transcript_23392:839-1462(-)